MRVLKALVPALLLIVFMIGTTEAQEKKNENDGVFFVVEEMPKYPGGEDSLKSFIANNVKYPKIAVEKGIQGKVYVTFVVDTDGSVAESRIARGVDPALDKEALRVINSMETWTPGKEKGKPVKVSYTVPINFALNDKKQVKKKEGDVYFIVEEMPIYPGGDKALREFITNNVKYPEIAQKEGIQGRVYVTFVVDVDGSISKASIARGVDPSLDKEALRVVNSLPAWTPGKEKGKPVKVSYTVPISFALK